MFYLKLFCLNIIVFIGCFLEDTSVEGDVTWLGIGVSRETKKASDYSDAFLKNNYIFSKVQKPPSLHFIIVNKELPALK